MANDVNIRINAQDNASAALKDVAVGLTAIGVAAGVTLKKGLDTFVEFDKAANKVKAFLDPAERTVENLKMIKDEAKRMGAQLPLMNAEILMGAVALEKAGFSAQQVTDALAGISLAAVANDIQDVSYVAEVAADTLSIFKLEATDTKNALDTMTKAANSTNTDFVRFNETMKYGALVASAAGQDLETTATLVALMGKNALKSSQAGTNFRQMMLKFSSEAERAGDGAYYIASAIGEIAIPLSDTEGNFRNMVDVVKDVKGALEGMNPVMQQQVTKQLAGVRGGQALLAMMNNTEETMDTLTSKIKNANGTLDEMAAIMQEGVSGAFLLLEAQMDSFWNALGEGIGSVLQPFVRGLVELVGWVAKNETAMTLIAGVLTGAFAGGLVGAAILLWGVIAPAIVLSAQFALVGAAIFLVIDNIDFLIAAFQPLISVITNFINDNMAKFNEWKNSLITIFENITTMIQLNWDVVSAIFSAAFGGILLAWEFFWQDIKLIFDIAWAVLSGTITIVLAVLAGDWGRAWNGIKGIFIGIWNAMGDFLNGRLETIKGALSGAFSFIQDKVIQPFIDWAKPAWDGFWGSIGGVVEFVGGVISGIVDGIVATIQALISAIVNLIKQAKKLASEAGTNIIAQSAVSSIAPGLGGFGIAAGGLARNAAGGTANAGQSFVAGEHGPEIVTPTFNSRITPNDKVGGGGITINVNGPVIGTEEFAETLMDVALSKLQQSTAVITNS